MDHLKKISELEETVAVDGAHLLTPTDIMLTLNPDAPGKEYIRPGNYGTPNISLIGTKNIATNFAEFLHIELGQTFGLFPLESQDPEAEFYPKENISSLYALISKDMSHMYALKRYHASLEPGFIAIKQLTPKEPTVDLSKYTRHNRGSTKPGDHPVLYEGFFDKGFTPNTLVNIKKTDF